MLARKRKAIPTLTTKRNPKKSRRELFADEVARSLFLKAMEAEL